MLGDHLIWYSEWSLTIDLTALVNFIEPNTEIDYRRYITVQSQRETRHEPQLPCGYTSLLHTASVNVDSRQLLMDAVALRQCLYHPDHQMQRDSKEEEKK